MKQDAERLYLSTYFIEDCLGKFRQHKRHWWEAQKRNREGETCCLLWDLLTVVETDKKLVYSEGLQVLAWWMYDRKYFDPERTVYFDVKLLREYQLFDFIWGFYNLLEDKVFVLMYAYLHSLSMGEDGPLNFIEQSVKAGKFLSAFDSYPGLTGMAAKADQLKEIMGRYLEIKRPAAPPAAGPLKV